MTNKKILHDAPLPETIEECEDELTLIEIRRAMLEDEIAFAAGEAARTGRYADNDWFRDTKLEHKLLGARYQRMSRLLGNLRRREGEAQRRALGDRFIALAKARLSEAVFYDLLASAQSTTEEA